MSANELKDKYWSLYEFMASSRKPENMKAFGRVMTAMMDDMITNSPSKAEEYIGKLESIKWNNYLTPAEADKIVAAMDPKAPWSRDQWKAAMQQNGLELEKWPCYNRCALYTTMNMIMSDSSATLSQFVSGNDLFKAVYQLAVDKLTDQDGMFNIRSYFGV